VVHGVLHVLGHEHPEGAIARSPRCGCARNACFGASPVGRNDGHARRVGHHAGRGGDRDAAVDGGRRVARVSRVGVVHGISSGVRRARAAAPSAFDGTNPGVYRRRRRDRHGAPSRRDAVHGPRTRDRGSRGSRLRAHGGRGPRHRLLQRVRDVCATHTNGAGGRRVAEPGRGTGRGDRSHTARGHSAQPVERDRA
jgi:hypothetical protein